MNKLLKTIGVAALVLAAVFQVQAGWLDDFKTSAVGGYRQAEFTHGPGQWAAGVAVEAPFNKYVSGTARVLAYEGEDHRWRGGAIDEIQAGVSSTLLSSANKQFSTGVKGGVDRNEELDDWGFDLGVWARWQPGKRLYFDAGRELTAWFSNRRDWFTYGAVGWKW